MPNPFAYCELHTPDTAAAKSFYGRLFDWKLKDSPTPKGTYTEIEIGEGFPGGLTGQSGAASQWLTYVRVADVDASMSRAQSLGGKVLAPKTEVPDAGWFAVLSDPTGVAFGLWQPRNP
jgi:predicted enzyme related to lactoylglutathione lyase